MPQGVTSARVLQLGRETTAGTAVAATARWRGMGVIKDAREIGFVEEQTGYISGIDDTFTARLMAEISMDSVPASAEQLPYVLEAGVKSVQTGAADGAGSGRIYTYAMPTTQSNTTATYTIEGGDNAGYEEAEYCFVESFTLEGSGGEMVMMSADWMGRQVQTAALTGGVSLPAVDYFAFNKGKMYIDPVGGTLGATQVTQTFLEFSLDVETGVQAVETADGELYFTFTKQAESEVILNVTFEHNDSSITEKDNWRNETPRQIRILFEGATLTTAGSYSKKTLQIDLAGKWEDFDALGDRDGNDIVDGTFRARYNATADLFCQFVIVNELANLT